MTNQTARFTGNALVGEVSTPAQLHVKLRNGKKGFNISASLKVVGQPTKTICQETFATEKPVDAQQRFEARIAEAEANGWTRNVRVVKEVVTTIPASVPAPPVVEAPPVVKTTPAEAKAKPVARAARKRA